MSGKAIFGITFLVLLLGISACSTDAPKATEPTVGTSEQQSEPMGQVIATVGDKKLTLEQLEWISRRRGGPSPSPRTIYRIAEYWIDVELLSQEAWKLGLQKSDKAEFMADFGVKDAHANAMIDYIRDNTEVTEQDVLDYYEENKDISSQIKDPPKFSFSHIRTKTLEAAQAALERLKQGENINELAKELSVYYDSQRGGKVEGLIERAVKTGYGAEFLKALEAASEGELVGPIKTSNDFYEVAKLEGKLEARIKPLEYVKDKLRTTLTYRFQSQNIEEQLKALKEKTKTEILYSPSMNQPQPRRHIQ
jgi:hypothetical protein